MAKRKPLDQLLLVGDQMSNLCFNLPQHHGQTECNKQVMRELVTKWDYARRLMQTEARAPKPAKRKAR